MRHTPVDLAQGRMVPVNVNQFLAGVMEIVNGFGDNVYQKVCN